MMKTLIQLTIISMLMLVTAPAWSGSISYTYKCEQQDEASDQDVLAAASAWLKAAKKLKGGDKLEASVHFPVVATMGDTDFLFVVKAPSLAEWGVFMDSYQGPALAKEDKKFAELAACPDSSLFESVQVKIDTPSPEKTSSK